MFINLKQINLFTIFILPLIGYVFQLRIALNLNHQTDLLTTYKKGLGNSHHNFYN